MILTLLLSSTDNSANAVEIHQQADSYSFKHHHHSKKSEKRKAKKAKKAELRKLQDKKDAEEL